MQSTTSSLRVGELSVSHAVDAAPVFTPDEIVIRFGHRLLRLATKKLDRRLAARLDEHDVLQSVLRSFFNRHNRGGFRIHSWDELWALLAVMTTRKCLKQAQWHFAERRDIRRNLELEEQIQFSPGGTPAAALGPTPDEPLLLTEASERLSSELTPRERDVLALALAGHTVEHIAAQVGRTQRTVRRLLGRTRDRLERMAAEFA